MGLVKSLLLVILAGVGVAVALVPRHARTPTGRADFRLLSMVATEKPPVKKIQKIELTKINSNYLRDPLEEEMKNEEIFVSHDGTQLQLHPCPLTLIP